MFSHANLLQSGLRCPSVLRVLCISQLAVCARCTTWRCTGPTRCTARRSLSVSALQSARGRPVCPVWLHSAEEGHRRGQPSSFRLVCRQTVRGALTRHQPKLWQVGVYCRAKHVVVMGQETYLLRTKDLIVMSRFLPVSRQSSRSVSRNIRRR